VHRLGRRGGPTLAAGHGPGMVTAEYSMLPGSTPERASREAARGKQSGRTHEIQRLIGRSLRTVTRLELLADVQITVDCDVLQADGGTRTGVDLRGLRRPARRDHALGPGRYGQGARVK